MTNESRDQEKNQTRELVSAVESSRAETLADVAKVR